MRAIFFISKYHKKSEKDGYIRERKRQREGGIAGEQFGETKRNDEKRTI